MNQMNYPSIIQPQQSYKIIDTSELLEGYFLIRRCDKIQSEILDDIDDIRIDVVFDRNGVSKYEDLYGWSANLLGIFEIAYLCFKPLVKTLTTNWNPGDLPCEIREEDYEIIPNYVPIFLMISEIHNLDFIYKKKPTETNDSVGKCKVVHSPTLCNFWHFELHFFDKDKIKISNSASTWKKQAARNFLNSYLKELLTINEPKDYNVLKDFILQK